MIKRTGKGKIIENYETVGLSPEQWDHNFGGNKKDNLSI